MATQTSEEADLLTEFRKLDDLDRASVFGFVAGIAAGSEARKSEEARRRRQLRRLGGAKVIPLPRPSSI